MLKKDNISSINKENKGIVERGRRGARERGTIYQQSTESMTRDRARREAKRDERQSMTRHHDLAGIIGRIVVL
jgi:hypothetical protein